MQESVVHRYIILCMYVHCHKHVMYVHTEMKQVVGHLGQFSCLFSCLHIAILLAHRSSVVLIKQHT